MKRKRFASPHIDSDVGWRAYQETLKKDALKQRIRRRLPRWVFFALVVAVVVCAAYGASVIGLWPQDISARLIDREQDPAAETTGKDTPNRLDKQTVRRILAGIDPHRVLTDTIIHEKDGVRYRIKTTIDMGLQNHLVDKLRLEHARYLGIVVLDPATGRILAMISHDRSDPNRNVCLENRFPAASIFKIITASAAIETCNLNPDSTLLFNGRKHTLYKSQLKNKNNRYTRRITLEDAFAQSINPVFGKLGAHRLGKDTLLSYAEAFGFNREFDLELDIASSRFTVADDSPYQWAEMASGFNQDTTLSPLHGAMIASAIVNDGQLIEPILIESITDENGRILYRGKTTAIQKAIEPPTATILAQFMETTVRKGTARKTFKGYRRDRVLSRLALGGKTGSINNDPRFDWFVGFAREKKGHRSVVVSVLVAHEKFIGIKSGQYARMAIKSYFEDYFSKKDAPETATTVKVKKG